MFPFRSPFFLMHRLRAVPLCRCHRGSLRQTVWQTEPIGVTCWNIVVIDRFRGDRRSQIDGAVAISREISTTGHWIVEAATPNWCRDSIGPSDRQ